MDRSVVEAKVSEPDLRVNRGRRAVLAPHSVSELSTDALSVLATLPIWWRRRARAAGVRSVHGLRVDEAVAARPILDLETLIDVEPREDLLDAGPEAVADAYVVALDQAVRTADGRHYTPAQLAEVLFRQALDALGAAPTGLIWDPASGAGSLLFPALRAWVAARHDMQPELLLTAAPLAIGGRDLDHAAVWLGNVLLAAELLESWANVPAKRRKPLPVLLGVGDGLVPPSVSPQVAVLNPPYGRVRLSLDPPAGFPRLLVG